MQPSTNAVKEYVYTDKYKKGIFFVAGTNDKLFIMGNLKENGTINLFFISPTKFINGPVAITELPFKSIIFEYNDKIPICLLVLYT